ncbi:odorant receptor 4 [Plodia interpunctella]|uniref:odorant receptor 4 n=1 Tax=Plodia interpunctella TaxID=58824 RepID=UPI002368B047|nr:odorant receptor 4-like [Plodia interpunctella]XP_053608705.1 odorant receptor 4-like [Plodia interpunctella]
MEYLNKYPEEYARPLVSLFAYLGRLNVKFFNHDMPWFYRNWRFFYIVPILVFHFITMSVYIVEVFVEGVDVFTDVFMIPIYLVHIHSFSKMTILNINKERFEKVIDELGQTWRTDNLNDVQKDIKRSSEKELWMVQLVFMKLPICVASQYVLLPILDTLFCNVILREDDEVRLPLRCSYPFDPSSSWVLYGITYCFQTYCIFNLTFSYVATDFIFLCLSAQLSVEFMLLREDLLHIKPTKVVDNDVTHIVYDNGKIRDFVIYHQKLLRLAEELNCASNKIMFVNLFFTAVNVSLFGLAVLVANNASDKITNLIVILTILVLILTVCYSSEKLKSASEEIFNSACENLWYEGDKEYKQIILFIMKRSQKPCYLKSLDVPITHATFTTVMRTTWSYFSLMNKMYENEETN